MHLIICHGPNVWYAYAPGRGLSDCYYLITTGHICDIRKHGKIGHELFKTNRELFQVLSKYHKFYQTGKKRCIHPWNVKSVKITSEIKFY